MSEPLRTPPAWAPSVAAITRRLPVGRYRALAALPRTARPFVASFPPDPALHFVCDLTDAISREVYFAGSYEPQLTRLIPVLLPRDGVAVDVGANWGYFTLLCAATGGRQGRVFSFEPEPRLFRRLLDQVRVNDLQNVFAYEAAASASEGAAWLLGYEEGAEHRGESRLSDVVGTRGTAVRTVAVDAVLEAAAVSQADLIKIDVEGAETAVIEGMSAGLSAARYRHLLIEWHPQQLPESQIAMAVRRLEACGYSGWTVDHSAQATRDAAYCGRVRLQRARLPVEARWPHWLLVRRDDREATRAALSGVATFA